MTVARYYYMVGLSPKLKPHRQQAGKRITDDMTKLRCASDIKNSAALRQQLQLHSHNNCATSPGSIASCRDRH